MIHAFIEEAIDYTGEQLGSLWALERFGLQGDSIVAFIGRADVDVPHLVDRRDALAGRGICSQKMLHFIVEHFDTDLEKTICRQRLLVCIIREELEQRVRGVSLIRRGDDLFFGDRKLTVSVATVSPVSSLIHTGVNIVAEGAPVPACGLSEWDLDARETGKLVAERYAAEVASIRKARCKVRAVQ
ncbi:MAG: DUF366 family protein [Armatimonadota bacterium]|jgi:hypothetical protein